jgi:hypothetical protein
MKPKMSLIERFVRVLLGLLMKVVPLFNSAAIFDIAAVSIPIIFAGGAVIVTGLFGVRPIYRLWVS